MKNTTFKLIMLLAFMFVFVTNFAGPQLSMITHFIIAFGVVLLTVYSIEKAVSRPHT